MANVVAKLYNFYRRYKWRAADFQGWQSGMIDYARGIQEGNFGASCLRGYAPSLTGGMGIDVSAGLACGPTGNFMGTGATVSITVTPPASDQERDLVVVRPLLTNADLITSPTDPSQTVPLTTIQGAQVLLLRGTAAAFPAYPAKGPNDTVLFGVRVNAGQATLVSSDLDFEVRDIPGKNSNFQQDFGKYDDRLRCYLVGAPMVGIKPSQLEPPLARVFSYISRKSPSIYPKSSGSYNPIDTFVNMKTGAISGGDTTSSPLTPMIPTAGNAIVATLSITTADLLVCAYGTQGTRQQCFNGVKNQLALGAGAVAFTANSKPIAFLIIYSVDGTNVTEIDLFDARSLGGVGDNDAAQTAALSTILVTTGNTTNGSKNVTGIPSTTALKKGMKIAGTGIPSNSFVQSIVSGTAITINTPATATGSAVALTFSHAVATGTTVQTQLDALDGLVNAVQRDAGNIFTGGQILPLSQAATFVAGSAVVTGIVDLSNVLAGQLIVSAGSGVPAFTYVRKVLSSTSIEMSRVSPFTGTDQVSFGNTITVAGTVQGQLDDLDRYQLAWQDQIVTLTAADSPFAIDSSDIIGQTGITYVCDTTGGPIRIDLPLKADVPEGFRLRVMSNGHALTNAITIKHPTGSNINDAASDFVIKSLFSACDVFWSRDNNSWYVAFLPRHYLANDTAGSGKAAFGFELDPTTGITRGSNNRTTVLHGGVESAQFSDQGIATADDLLQPIKWMTFIGSLTATTNVDLTVPGITIGVVGMNSTDFVPVDSTSVVNNLKWQASPSTAKIRMRNPDSSPKSYRVTVFYQ